MVRSGQKHGPIIFHSSITDSPETKLPTNTQGNNDMRSMFLSSLAAAISVNPANPAVNRARLMRLNINQTDPTPQGSGAGFGQSQCVKE